jgi:hypothetical protein
MSIIQGTAKSGSASFYDFPIGDSLRFDGSSYLSRTPTTASNRRTWTWSGWIKRNALGSTQGIFARNDASVASYFIWNSNNKLEFASASSGVEAQIITTPVYRDLSAWYHIMIAFDTTQGTSSNKIKFYVNGILLTAMDTSSYPSTPNYEGYINTASTHYIGNGNPGGSLGWYSAQYLANIQFIDGQALDQYFFGEFKDNIWVPYNAFSTAGSGTATASDGDTAADSYGTNGFHLDFADSSNIGNDVSGNNNDWTVN